jgi:hypothetical protein
MSAAAMSPRPLITAAQLEHRIEADTPVAILDAQLMQLVDHPQRLDTDALCGLLAVLDQQHRRGRLSAQDFRQLKGRLEPLIVSGGHRPAPPRPAPALRSVPPVPREAPPPEPPLREMPLDDLPRVARPPLAAGQVLRGRYELRRLLGEGGMSCVWEAVDRMRGASEGRQPVVALKLLRPSVAARGDAVQALHREFERAQSLSHPSIVNVLALDADEDVHFITMERLEGELLSEVIKRLRPGHMPREQAFAILARLGDAVAFAHAGGIVHADVKPGNVMLTRGGDLRLFDFGAAWPAQREPWIYEVSERSLQGATPTYASAERLGGAAPTVRDDVFSYSCLAYELLTGNHPFDRQPAHEAERHGLRARRVPGLTRTQWRALAKGLSFRREDRWADMGAYLAALLPEAAARVPLPLHYEAVAARRPRRLSGITMLLLGGAAFAIAHYANAELPPALQSIVDAARTVLASALALVR